MSTEQTPDTSQPQGESIADRNVERLVAAAYRPETPSEDFARRLQAAAQARATTRKETTAMTDLSVSEHAGARSGAVRLVGWGVAAAVVAAAVVGLIVLNVKAPPRHDTGVAAPVPEKTAGAAGQPQTGEAKPKLVPLKLELPKPLFEGTPKNMKGWKLAPPRGNEPFLVPEGCKNVSLHKPVTSSDAEPTVGDLKQVTDGDKEAVEGSYIELGPGLQWVQIDLRQACNIYAIVMWHFHKEARVYRDVVVQVADDSDFITGVRTIFNNDADNSAGLGVGADMEYLDEYTGKLIDAKGVKARYVRCYSKGNTSNDQNHYTEVEIHGIPAR